MKWREAHITKDFEGDQGTGIWANEQMYRKSIQFDIRELRFFFFCCSFSVFAFSNAAHLPFAVCSSAADEWKWYHNVLFLWRSLVSPIIGLRRARAREEKEKKEQEEDERVAVSVSQSPCAAVSVTSTGKRCGWMGWGRATITTSVGM